MCIQLCIFKLKKRLWGGATGTRIEIALAKMLFVRGLRYRKNDKTVFGKPDLTFKKYKIAIFIDGEFWHGKEWEIRKHDHKSNRDFWHSKIERNMERDKEVIAKLSMQGWSVLIAFLGQRYYQIENENVIVQNDKERVLHQKDLFDFSQPFNNSILSKMIISRLGEAPVFFNASKNSNVIFKITPNLTETELITLNDIETYGKRFAWLQETAHKLEFVKMNSDIFCSNLELIDSSMP